jgi:ribosomal protein S12 methylthiotransferase
MADAPEIDGNVFIEGDGAIALKVGSFAQVRITDADDYDLYAELIEGDAGASRLIFKNVG